MEQILVFVLIQMIGMSGLRVVIRHFEHLYEYGTQVKEYEKFINDQEIYSFVGLLLVLVLILVCLRWTCLGLRLMLVEMLASVVLTRVIYIGHLNIFSYGEMYFEEKFY
jgi:hypothetical protein